LTGMPPRVTIRLCRSERLCLRDMDVYMKFEKKQGVGARSSGKRACHELQLFAAA